MTRSLTEQEAAFYRNTGEWIRTRRRKKKISTVKLGKRLGVNRNSVMRWEAGRPVKRMDVRAGVRGIEAEGGCVVGKETGISWTDHTFNPWWGCTKVSAGCDHCYAEAFDKRTGGSHWGKGQPRRVFGEKHWAEPLKWEAAAAKAGKPAKVFCASMADVMDDEAPEGQRERLWELIDRTPNLIWQLLTKRPQRYERNLPADFKHGNVWLGTTTEDQPNYDLRWPLLAKAATSRNLTSFVSYEPAIGPVTPLRPQFLFAPDWLIFGGESGSGRRPMQREWAEQAMADCRVTGTAFFMKQFGARSPSEGAKLVPAEMLVREFPGGAA